MQILDEMNDNGFPFTTEPNVLKEMIAPPSVLGQLGQMFLDDHSSEQKLPEGATSNIQWRKMGVKYTNNEIYLDLIESVDTIVDRYARMVGAFVGRSATQRSRLGEKRGDSGQTVRTARVSCAALCVRLSCMCVLWTARR